jgi:cobalamin biosynthesis Mg chelatase CobN
LIIYIRKRSSIDKALADSNEAMESATSSSNDSEDYESNNTSDSLRPSPPRTTFEENRQHQQTSSSSSTAIITATTTTTTPGTAQPPRKRFMNLQRRMIIWSVAYHLFAIFYAIQTALAAISVLSDQDTSQTNNAEDSESWIVRDQTTRAGALVYILAALGGVMFGCFGVVSF